MLNTKSGCVCSDCLFKDEMRSICYNYPNANISILEFDTIVMNPPFGTRNTGIDSIFVLNAMKISNVVYSLHKTSTREVSVYLNVAMQLCITLHLLYSPLLFFIYLYHALPLVLCFLFHSSFLVFYQTGRQEWLGHRGRC